MLWSLVLVLAWQDAGATAGAPPAVNPLPVVDALNSTNFVISGARLRSAGDNVRLEGTVCRRTNRSVISPTRIQIDHTSATDGALETSYAYLPMLSQREDQRCGHFGTKLKSIPQAGDRYKVCIPHAKGACASTK